MRFRQSVWFRSLSTSHHHSYSRARQRAAIVLTLLSALQTPLVYSQQLVEYVEEKRKGEDDGGAGAQCVWVAAWAGDSINDGNSRSYLKYLQKSFDYSDKKSVPGCFGAFWRKLCPGINGRGVTTDAGGSIERYGACAVPLKNGARGSTSLPKKLAEFLGAPTKITDNSGNWFMDSECRYRQNITGAKLCGFAGVATSPISLVFDESSALDADMTVVDFSIDLNKPGSFSLWKGSDKAPLLVYDPDRSGNVATAARLFGNYTFGGRTSDLSQIKLDSRIDRPVWGNGYEALSLLDTNHDGKVSGAELEPIALWFDTNRDARSDSGEVKSLASVGITALYYLNPLGRAGSDDIGLELGYERVVDGRVVQGRSVDWYGETFASKAEAAQALGAILSANADRARLELERDWREDSLAFKPHIAKDHSADLSGFWRWHMIDDEDASNPGAFAFEQSDDRTLKGFSVVETVLQTNAQGLRSSVAILPAQGTVEVDAKGLRTLKLTVTNPENGSTAETTATIEEDGVVLKGKTVQKFISSTQPNAKSATLTYEWVAQKFIADAGESKN